MKAIIILLALLFSYNANSQSLSLFDIDASEFPKMKAKFLAFDENGKQIRPNVNDLKLTEDGNERTITNVSCPPEQPIKAVSIAMSIDVSGSMNSNNEGEIPVQLGKRTALTLLENIKNPNSDFAVQICNHQAKIVQDFTRNRDKVVLALNKIEANGDNNFKQQLLNEITGLLNIAKAGKSKKIAVLYTDAWWHPLTDEELQECKNICIENNIEFYAIIYSRKEAEPNGIKKSLRELVNFTGGKFYDGIGSEAAAKDVAYKIQHFVQELEACIIEWEAEIQCFGEQTEIVLENKNIQTTEFYSLPSQFQSKLEFSSPIFRFNNPQIGVLEEGYVTVTARNTSYNVTNVSSSNPAFSITPTNFNLEPNQQQLITIRYTAQDSSYDYTNFTFEGNFCNQLLFASAGYIGIPPKTPSIKLTFPNGGESFVVGGSTEITWEGISIEDSVRLEYSVDNGVSWKTIAEKVAGLRYNWEKIPFPLSNNCLVRINQIDGAISYNSITLADHTYFVSDLSFSPDGKYLISGSGDSNVKLWEVQTGNLVYTFTENNDQIRSVAFSPDGTKIAAAGDSRSVLIWDVDSKEYLGYLFGHGNRISSIAFHPNGKTFASGSFDGTIKYWDLENYSIIRTVPILDPSTNPFPERVNAIAYSPDGKNLVAAGHGGTLKIWNNDNGQEILSINLTLFQAPLSVAYSPDGSKIATGRSRSSAWIWDAKTGVAFRSFTELVGNISKISFSPDGTKLATAGQFAKVWDINTVKEIITISEHRDIVTAIAFSPVGNKLATGSYDKTIKIWDMTEIPLQSDQSDAVFSIVAPEADAVNVDMLECLVGSSKDSVVNEFVLNTGSWKFRVDSIYIRGADAGAFVLIGGVPKYEIQPNSSYFAEFNFRPIRAGLHQAEIVIITQADTIFRTIQGIGVNPQLQILTDIIDFGLVEVGDQNTIEQIAVIKNVSNQDIEITAVKQLGPDMVQFNILTGGESFILRAGEEHTMNLQFQPRYGGRTSGQIGFEYNSFASPAIAQLFGTGIGGEIVVDDYEAYVGDNINIGLKLTNINPEGLAELAPKFKAKVEVNGTLLYSNAGKIIAQNGSLVTYEFDGYIGNSEFLYEIPMKVGFGNALSTDIKVLNVELFDENGQLLDYDMELYSGSFTLLGVCYEGGVRLVEPNSSPVVLSINPNPSNSNVNIEFTLIEKGETELYIMDNQGKVVYNSKINSEPGTVSLELATDKFSNGLYSVILQTPTIKSTQQLLIIK